MKVIFLENLCPHCGKNSSDESFCSFCDKPITSGFIETEEPGKFSSYDEKNAEVLPKEKAYEEVKGIILNQQEIEKKSKFKNMAIAGVVLLIIAYSVWSFIYGRIVQKHISEGAGCMKEGLKSLGKPIPWSGAGDFQFAIDSFEKAIKMNKKNPEPYCYTGMSYYYKYALLMYKVDEKPDLANLDKMLEYLTQAINLREDYPQARVYLALYYYEKEDYFKASEELDKARNLSETAWRMDSEKKMKEWKIFIQKFKDKLAEQKFVRLFPPVPVQ